MVNHVFYTKSHVGIVNLCDIVKLAPKPCFCKKNAKLPKYLLLLGPKSDNMVCLTPFNHLSPTAPREFDCLFGMPILTLSAVVTHCSKTPNLVAMKLKRRVAPGHKARKGLERFRPAG